MIGVVLLCLAATEFTVALLAGRGPGAVPTARHRLIGLGVGAVVVLLTLVFVALTSSLGGHGGSGGADAAPVLLAGALALAAGCAWTAAGTRAWASPVLVAVLVLLAGLELVAYGGLHVALGSGWPVVLGALAFLIEPGNRITRDVLVLAGRPSTQDGPPAPAQAPADDPRDDAVSETTGEAAVAAAVEVPPDAPTAGADASTGTTEESGAPDSGLRGGRWIGPVERLLLAGLGLAGAYQVVAALMAAKGIVRFPEISADAGKGSRAEEFLVGSLTSWGLAFVSALLIFAAAHGPLLEVPSP
ncbi:MULTISPECIES: hypothetical protein [Micrococcus]|uniref:Integral membrane protein n=1 Tax=Micrococcus lylae TaxID=1273 RepID=A0ABY2K1G8_9MICC|nr:MULTISPECIES: hypothetical protein [Micrococcus]OFR86331.1 hypothetical protein HMPREF2863_04415 [Micrococcus sp. HMSC067E09]PNL17965.1 hypothetical protein CEQ11_007615 [Micrococcus sp. FDAARGOS_333]TFI00843.1 hypothetical protein E4A49_02335 [Micrococcus lylae]